MLPENFKNTIKSVTDKIEQLNQVSSMRSLVLPKKYGPFCMKILHDFIDHHKLCKDLPKPEPGLLIHLSMSRIFDVMLHSMGEEKRNNILKEVEDYNKNNNN